MRITTETKLQKFYQSLPNSFAEAHLDAKVYLEDGLYLLKNGDFGAFYEIKGIYDEILDEEELKSALNPIMKGLRNIVRGIPAHQHLKNTVVQIICSQRVLNKAPINNYSNSVVGSILNTEEELLFTKLGLLQRKIYLTIRYSPVAKKESSFKKVLDPVKSIFKDYTKKYEAIKENEELQFKRSLDLFKNELTLLEQQFTSDKRPKRLGPESYVNYIQNILHGGEDRPVIVNDDDLALSIYNQELLVNGPKIELVDRNAEEKTVNNKFIKIYFLEQLPQQYKYGMFRHFMDYIPTKNWDLVWTLSDGLGIYDSTLSAREGWYGRKASKRTQFEDYVSFRENVDPFRPHGIQSLRLICYNEGNSFDASLESIALDFIGARMVLERQIPVHMLASSLPLNCSQTSNKIKGRYRRIRLENALAFMPIYVGPDSEYGHRYFSSRGLHPCRFDLFAGEGNRMTTVLGATRAGKSVLTNQLILEFLDRYPDGIVRIIDKRTSYLKLADLLEGKIINFSEDALRNDPYSPFALAEWNEDDVENIFLLILTAIVQKNAGIRISSIHTEILREAIKISYNNQAKNLQMATSSSKVDPHPIWEDILSNLPVASTNLQNGGAHGLDAAKDDLVLWSLSLTKTGQYGFIFSKHEHQLPTTDLKLLVYDLDGNSDPVLRQLSAMMAFIKISRDLAKMPRSSKKLIIFEELGMLLHGNDEAQKLNEEFIQNVVKTCAKLNAQALALTNNIDDYANKPAGKTLWENASQKIFLPLGGLYDNAYKVWNEQYNEAEWQILKSLKKEMDYKRSSVFIKSNNDVAPWSGSIFIFLTAAMDALTTSSGSQMELYKKLRLEGKNASEALTKMWSDHPYGENL